MSRARRAQTTSWAKAGGTARETRDNDAFRHNLQGTQTPAKTDVRFVTPRPTTSVAGIILMCDSCRFPTCSYFSPRTTSSSVSTLTHVRDHNACCAETVPVLHQLVRSTIMTAGIPSLEMRDCDCQLARTRYPDLTPTVPNTLIGKISIKRN